jgi:hypothetical protein
MNPNHNPDHTIDRVLHALRDATPPSGMNRRILNILEAESDRATQHASQTGLLTLLYKVLESVIPSEAQRSRGTPAFRDAHTTRLPLWRPLTAALALIVAPTVILTARHHPAPASTGPSTTATIESTPAQPPDPIATTLAKPIHRTLAPAHPSQPHRIETTQPEEGAQISHPAPPIPLTDQERILLRYAHRGRAEDLAQITNDRKAAKEEQEAAEFQAFFTPPEIPLGESE